MLEQLTHLSLFSGIGGTTKEDTVKQFSEETRCKMAESARHRCTPEWRARKSEAQSTKLDADMVSKFYKAGMTQSEIARELCVSQKVIWRFMKNNRMPARVPAKRNQIGENNDSWKGEQALYGSFHARVASRRGPAKAHGCSVCGTHAEEKTYDWANLTGNYNDTNDYAPMCRVCHRRYDAQRRMI